MHGCVPLRKLIHFFEPLAGARRFIRTYYCDGKIRRAPQHRVADLGSRYMSSEALAHDSAKLHLGYAHASSLKSFEYLPRYRETHVLKTSCWRFQFGNRDLAECSVAIILAD